MHMMMIAGQALSLVGTIAGGRQAEKIGNRNAATLNEQADSTRRATYDREGLLRERNAQTLSGQNVALLQNGVDPTTGTALIGVAQNTRDADMDALMTRYEGLMQGRDQNIQAGMARYEGKAKKRQSYFSAAGQLLSAGAGYLGGQRIGPPAPVETRTPTPNPYYTGR